MGVLNTLGLLVGNVSELNSVEMKHTKDSLTAVQSILEFARTIAINANLDNVDSVCACLKSIYSRLSGRILTCPQYSIKSKDEHTQSFLPWEYFILMIADIPTEDEWRLEWSAKCFTQTLDSLQECGILNDETLCRIHEIIHAYFKQVKTFTAVWTVLSKLIVYMYYITYIHTYAICIVTNALENFQKETCSTLLIQTLKYVSLISF